MLAAYRLPGAALLMLLVACVMTSAASAETFVNRWTQAAITTQNGAPVALQDTRGVNWALEDAGGGFVRLKTTGTGAYLHVENGPLELGPIEPGWWSAQWTIEQAGDGFVRIKNRWKGTYLNIERGPLVATAIEPGWWSAQWQVAADVARAFPETYKSPTEGRSTKVRTFDQYAWLTAHNAFLNYTDARWTAPNQSYGIVGQLDRGVRGLMLDVYDFAGSGDALCVVSLTADCYPAGVYLCHSDCTSLVGATYALPRQPLKDVLDAIGDWLSTHTGEQDIVTIFFEDYTDNGTLAAVIRSSRAAPYIFNPAAAPWSVKSNGWPTLAAMQQAGTRLLLFTSDSGNVDSGLGLVHDQAYNVENYWSLGDLGADYECKTRWGGIPLTQTEAKFGRLFVMNHFRNVPSTGTSAWDNKLSNLEERLGLCKTAAGRLPNYIALDYFELGSGGDFVVYLNGEWVAAANP